METNVILKYRREQDRWLCSECDSENSIMFGSCTVCGHKKTPDDYILKKWTEADERAESYSYKFDSSAAPGYGADIESAEEKNSGMGTVVGIILAIIILVIIGLISETYAADESYHSQYVIGDSFRQVDLYDGIYLPDGDGLHNIEADTIYNK